MHHGLGVEGRGQRLEPRLRDLAEKRRGLLRQPQVQHLLARVPVQFAKPRVLFQPEHRRKPHRLADDLGIVTYDANAKTVERAEHADDVAVYMEVVPKNALSWASYYFTVSLLGLLLLVAHGVGVPGLSTVDATLLGGTVFAVLCLSAVYHHLTQRDAALWFRD